MHKKREHLEKVRERRGIFKRMRGVGVRVTAAVRAEHLDGDLRRHRPLHDGLRVERLVFHHGISLGINDRFAIRIDFRDGNGLRLDEFRRRVRFEILNHALRHEKQREHEADRQQQIISDARHVHPEVADGRGRVPRDAAHERRRDRHADGGGKKVVDRQRDHLREIRHRGFAAVALPVGVRREADGGVERQMRRQRAEILRIERQKILQPQNRVGEQQAHEAENQHREGVLFPALFLRRIHAENPVGEFFQRAHHRVEPGAAVGIEHAAEIKAERLGDEDERAEIEREFQPLMGVHNCVVKIFPAGSWPR